MLSCWLCQGSQGRHPGDQLKAQEVGAVCHQVRDLESRLHDKEEALLSSLHRLSERDQELHRPPNSEGVVDYIPCVGTIRYHKVLRCVL
jgi:hypothetical protein